MAPTFMTTQPISYQRSTSEQLFAHIRHQIINLELAPGQKISENQLANKFEVSRTPVREALAKLSAQALVEVRPQRGTFVTKLSMQRLRDSAFIRQALEEAAAGELARHPDPALAARCDEHIARQRDAVSQGDVATFRQLDQEFHAMLVNAAGSERAVALVQTERVHLDRAANLNLPELSRRLITALQQHEVIVSAIKSGSGETASAAMRQHLQSVLESLQQAPRQYPQYFLAED